MLGQADDRQLDETRQLVARFSPEDVEDLQSIIFLGKKEPE
jgi:hypothetical protein